MEILYQPYTMHRGYTLDAMLKYVSKYAMEIGADPDMADTAVYEVFIELEKGKTYPINYCPCGCGINKSGTAITHEICRRIKFMDGQLMKKRKKYLNEKLNAIIEEHFKEEGERTIKEPASPKPSWLKRLVARGT